MEKIDTREMPYETEEQRLAYYRAEKVNDFLRAMDRVTHQLRYCADQIEQKVRHYQPVSEYHIDDWYATAMQLTMEILRERDRALDDGSLDTLAHYAYELDELFRDDRARAVAARKAEEEAAKEAANAHRKANPHVYIRANGNCNWRYLITMPAEELEGLVQDHRDGNCSQWVGAVETAGYHDDRPTQELSRSDATIRIAYRPR